VLPLLPGTLSCQTAQVIENAIRFRLSGAIDRDDGNIV
jgi:hypothetical protein